MKTIPQRSIIFSLVVLLFSSYTSYTDAMVQTSEQKAWKEKVGQMLMVGFRGTEIKENSFIIKLMSDINIGGVILFDYDVPTQSFPRNILNPRQTKRLIQELQERASTPLLVAVDAEGGRVNRLKPEYGFLKIPSAEEMGKTDLTKCQSTYEKLASQLSELGFNLNLAPVVDLNLNPENPVISSLERSFSQSHQVVTERALTFINAHQDKGVITALKHFPGHGSSRHDSHLGVTDVTKTYHDDELLPYQALIQAKKVDMVMPAHIMNQHIDPLYPATLSPAFIQNILREKLQFHGVVMADDLQMGAITKNFGFTEAAVRAVNAGCDILAISNNGRIYDETAVYRAFEAIVDGVESGRIPKQKISDSYQKIIRLKQKFDII